MTLVTKAFEALELYGYTTEDIDIVVFNGTSLDWEEFHKKAQLQTHHSPFCIVFNNGALLLFKRGKGGEYMNYSFEYYPVVRR